MHAGFWNIKFVNEAPTEPESNRWPTGGGHAPLPSAPSPPCATEPHNWALWLILYDATYKLVITYKRMQCPQ
ncbi:unnamed protein product, partial [Iphiclides podalirius]